MNTLLDSLASRTGDLPVLMTARETLTAARLVTRSHEARASWVKVLEGKAVTLLCHDSAGMFEALLALDGRVTRILIVDESLPSDTLKRFEETLSIEFRVTAQRDGIAVETLSPQERISHPMTEWVIPTSGTTGEPKLIAHTFASLTRSLKAATTTAAELRWGLLYSPTRFAGLQVMLQALCGGSALVVPDHPADLDASIALLRQHGCNALSATPSLWRKLAFSGLLDQLDLKLITLGGEAPDQKILDTLRQHFTQSKIRHIYASTEAGVGFSVADGMAGFPLSYLQLPPSSVELKLADNGMLLLRPAQCDQKLLSGNKSLTHENGWIASGDLVEIRGNRCHFLGRMNGSINVGGQKVHPSEIENILLDNNGVRAARVYGKPNPILGALVVADVIAAPDTNPDELKKCLREACAERLERYKRPALINLVHDFELTSAGKIKR